MRIALLLFALLTLVVVGCSDNTQTGSGQGRLVIEAFDAPGPDSVDAVLLHVIEVTVNHSDNGWSTIAEPDTIINFLDLVNGITVELADDSVSIGDYTELRLILADSNWIVINGDTLDLTTPSGQSSGVKLKADVTDSAGMYKLILPAGVYDITASAMGYTVADTSYTGIEVIGGMSDLTGLDFVLE